MQHCSLQHWTLLPSPVPSTTGRCFCFGSIPSFFLVLFLHWSPVAYWAPIDLGVHLSVLYLFALSYCSWGSQGKNTEVVCHSLLQWTTFYQNSPPCPIHFGWSWTAWLIVWFRQGCGPYDQIGYFSVIVSPQEIPRQFYLSLCVLVHTKYIWSLWTSLAGMGLDSKCDFTPPSILLGFPLCPWMWGFSSKSLSATLPPLQHCSVFYVDIFW